MTLGRTRERRSPYRKFLDGRDRRVARRAEDAGGGHRFRQPSPRLERGALLPDRRVREEAAALAGPKAAQCNEGHLGVAAGTSRQSPRSARTKPSVAALGPWAGPTI